MSEFLPDFATAGFNCSPNFGNRADGFAPSMVILHYTGMRTGRSAEDWLCNPASQVSCHYLVYQNGDAVQMVRERDRAWHAGKSYWRGVTDINSASIGIEMVNPGHEFGYEDFPDAQMNAVIALCADIVKRNRMDPAMILAHSDVAPGRKVDPGERFDWKRLHAAGLGHFVAAAAMRKGQILQKGDSGPAVREWQSMTSSYGYGIEITGLFDDRTVAVTDAFQRHFRPRRVDGRVDWSTRQTMRRLLRSMSGSAPTLIT